MARKFFILLSIIVFACIISPLVVLPCSVCKCGDHAFFVNGARVLPSGQWIFTLENFYTSKSSGLSMDLHEARNLSPHSAIQSVAHGYEDGRESQWQNSVQAIINHGISNRVMLMVTVPYSFNRISSTEETVRSQGIGDPEIMLMAHLGSWFNQRIAIAVTGGARVPLGEDQKKNNAGELLDQHGQIGSGAWAGIFGLQATMGTALLPLFLSGSYQVNGRNDHEFCYGNVWRFNLAGQRALGTAIDLIGEINGRSARHDDIGDRVDPNSGGTVVYFSPGVRVNLTQNLSLRGQVQIPFIEDLHGVQDEGTNFRGGLVWTR